MKYTSLYLDLIQSYTWDVFQHNLRSLIFIVRSKLNLHLYSFYFSQFVFKSLIIFVRKSCFLCTIRDICLCLLMHHWFTLIFGEKLKKCWNFPSIPRYQDQNILKMKKELDVQFFLTLCIHSGSSCVYLSNQCRPWSACHPSVHGLHCLQLSKYTNYPYIWNYFVQIERGIKQF